MEALSTRFGQVHFGKASLGDARRTNRLVQVADRCFLHPHDAFPKKFQNPADLQGFYRLMKHPKVTHASVLAPHQAVTRQRMEATPGVVLILQDTTVLDYSGLEAIAELGQVGDGRGRGYYCHNALAVAAATREVLGLAAQVLHRRRRAPKGEKRAARQQAPDRESRLWKTLSQQLPSAPAGAMWVEVADRGADITEYLDHAHEKGKHYVVRSQHNRWTERIDASPSEENEETVSRVQLHDLARSLPGQGRRVVEVAARQGQAARTASVSVSWQAVTLRPPRQRRGEERGVPLPTWVVRVGEDRPPAGVEPLEWILLTNVPVRTLAEAFERIDWYGMRWIIEEYHKAQKTGCDIETMQFSYQDRLAPAIGLLSVVAVQLLSLRDQCRHAEAKTRRATDFVPEEWVRLLSWWRHKKVGLDWSVYDFYYALARLGGHQNRKHDHPPGWLILWRGWTQLQAMLEGAAAANHAKM